MKKVLEIVNLYISIGEKSILKNLNFVVNEGDCVCILGSNGEGKSTILKAIMNHYLIEINKGEIIFENTNITNLSSEERSHLGIFLIYQNPIEIEGINQLDLYKSILNENNKKTNIANLYKTVKKNLEKINLNEDILEREVNVNFSGGEKKKNEIMQMLLLDPKLILVDEIDSGLDVDSMKTICGILKQELKIGKTIIFITHNKQMIEELKPNKVLLLFDKKIVKEGDYNFGLNVINDGFKKTLQSLNINVKKNKEKIDICVGDHFAKR